MLTFLYLRASGPILIHCRTESSENVVRLPRAISYLAGLSGLKFVLIALPASVASIMNQFRWKLRFC
jgi:hypothetical protein